MKPIFSVSYCFIHYIKSIDSIELQSLFLKDLDCFAKGNFFADSEEVAEDSEEVAENLSAEDQSAEDLSAEDQSAEDQSAEDQCVEDQHKNLHN